MGAIRWQWGGGLLLAVMMVVCGGCNDPQNNQSLAYQGKAGGDPTPAEVARMIEPNVLAISCLYDPFNPWIWDAEHTRVRGVKVGALYLLGPKSTGVFGDGIIRPRLSVAQRDEQGKLKYVLVKEWTLDVDQAMPFRAKKRTRWGWGYGLFLTWGDELDLRGRNIRLTVTFERRIDGLVITGATKDFRVPAQGGKG